MNENLVSKMTKGYYPDSENSVYDDLFTQYGKVIMNSLITTFGLDKALIEDKYGGDVDTIHNVRKIGVDKEMVYKNFQNEEIYKKLEKYDSKDYHRDSRFRNIKHQIREEFKKDFSPIKDQYTEKDIGFYGKSKAIPPENKAELDHILGASEIHQDRGRVLSGISGKELANSEWNFAWTNKSLNASMGAWANKINNEHRKKYGCDAPVDKIDMRAYIETHSELDEKTKKNMLFYYKKAKSESEKKINIAYYTSDKFRKDLINSAGKTGITMGIREGVGYILTELVFTLLEEFKNIRFRDIGDIFLALSNSVKKGIENIKEKYKEIFVKFKDGVISGILSSIAITLTNIFITTSKNIGRILRQVWVSIVQATKIIFLNPNNLAFGERMKEVVRILSTTASLILSITAREILTNIGVHTIPIIGGDVVNFIELLVMGLTNCTLLYFIDRSEIVKKIVAILDKIPTMSNVVNYYKQQAKYFERYACEILKIDVESFGKEIDKFNTLAKKIEYVGGEEELNFLLINFYKENGIKLPWEGEFKSFMGNKNNKLVFE